MEREMRWKGRWKSKESDKEELLCFHGGIVVNISVCIFLSLYFMTNTHICAFVLYTIYTYTTTTIPQGSITILCLYPRDHLGKTVLNKYLCI